MEDNELQEEPQDGAQGVADLQGPFANSQVLRDLIRQEGAAELIAARHCIGTPADARLAGQFAHTTRPWTHDPAALEWFYDHPDLTAFVQANYDGVRNLVSLFAPLDERSRAVRDLLNAVGYDLQRSAVDRATWSIRDVDLEAADRPERIRRAWTAVRTQDKAPDDPCAEFRAVLRAFLLAPSRVRAKRSRNRSRVPSRVALRRFGDRDIVDVARAAQLDWFDE